LSFTNNLFGAIAGVQGNLVRPAPDFIPIDGNGGTLKLTNTTASWLGLRSKNMQYWAYIYCAPLGSVVDRLAECDINGVLEAIKDDGTEDYSQSITVKRLMKQLSQPNVMQTWEQFRGQQIIYKKLFGYCPVFPIVPTGFSDPTYATSIWNIPPWLATPQINTGFNLFSTTGTTISSYSLSIFNDSVEIPGDKLMTLYDGFVQDTSTVGMMPLSKLAGLDYAISNICYAMEADNVLLRKKGPLGVWTHAPTSDNVAGYLPMTPDMKKELQNDLQGYGLSFDQFQYLVSRNSVRYEKAGFNVAELMTKETVKQGIEAICDKFGVPAEVMSFKDVTYENRAAAEKFMYQNNVIPNSVRDMRVYTNFFGLDKLGVKLCCDFDELPILAEDAAKVGSAMKSKTEAYQLQYYDDLITKNQYRQLIGQDSIQGDDIYYSQTAEYKTKQVQNAKQTQPANSGT
jgi:hypothetical protein